MAETIEISGAGVTVLVSEGIEIVEPGDLDTNTEAKKAAFRAAIGAGEGGAGQNQSEVQAEIDARTKVFARTGQRNISKDDIDSVFLEELQNGVEFGSVQASDDALEFESIGGMAKTIFKRQLALGTVTQEAVEAGTSDVPASVTPERLKQAIDALGIARVASLPRTSPIERVVFNTATDTLYRAATVTGARTFTLTQGEDEEPGEDDTGFVRGSYGSIDPDADDIAQLRWDDATNELRLHINTFADPGDYEAVITGQGNYTTTGNFNAATGTWEGTAAAPINPFLNAGTN